MSGFEWIVCVALVLICGILGFLLRAQQRIANGVAFLMQERVADKRKAREAHSATLQRLTRETGAQR